MLVRLSAYASSSASAPWCAQLSRNGRVMPNAAPPWERVATFSILGYDPDTGEVGGAVQSRVFCVGNGVICGSRRWRVATQASADIGYGPQRGAVEAGHGSCRRGEKSLGRRPGSAPAQLVEARPAVGGHQLKAKPRRSPAKKIVHGRVTKIGKNCTAQGNILAGEEVVNGMVDAFEKTEGHLACVCWRRSKPARRPAATSGMQSANMTIVKKNGGVWLHNDMVLQPASR